MCFLLDIKNYQYNIIQYKNKILIIVFKNFIVKKDENFNSKFSLNVSFLL